MSIPYNCDTEDLNVIPNTGCLTGDNADGRVAYNFSDTDANEADVSSTLEAVQVGDTLTIYDETAQAELTSFEVLQASDNGNGGWHWFLAAASGDLQQPTSGNSYSLTITPAAPAPDAPTGLSASLGDYVAKIALAWNAASGATAYDVYRGTGATFSASTKIAGDVSATSYDDTTATVGVLYWYWIVATAGGESSSESTPARGLRALDGQWIVTGHSALGQSGSYPTTATSQAEQLATDRAAVLAAAPYILQGHSILSQAGAYDLAAEQAAQYAAGQAAQLVTDQAAVLAAAGYIVTGQTILGQAGSYPTTATSQAAQLATDQAEVLANVEWIVIGHTILGQGGTNPGAAAVDVSASGRNAVVALAIARLKATTAIAALVGDRVRLARRYARDALPTITCRRISDNPDTHLGGTSAAGWQRIQVDVWAADYEAATELADLVHESLIAWSDAASTPRINMAKSMGQSDDDQPPLPGEEAWEERITMDFRVEYY